MEREVARIAAACDLRAFRYIPFAAVEFDPIPIAPEVEPAAEIPPLAVPEPAPATLPEPVAVAAVPPPPPIERLPEAPPIVFVRPPPAGRVPEPPPAVPAGRRYRMLEELAPAPEPEAVAPVPHPAGRPTPRPAMPALPGGAAVRPPSPTPHSSRPRGTTPRRAWPG